MEVNRKTRVVPLQVRDKIGWIALLLAEPSIPQVSDTLLITRGANDPQSMQINSALDDIYWHSLPTIDEDRIPLKENIDE